MKLYGLITEMLSGDVYHYTNFGAVYNILKTNRINLSSNLGASADLFGNKPFFLSLSRTGSYELGYGKRGGENKIRIVFNGNKLNARYKSISVDYWGLKKDMLTSDSFEYEDRIISEKPVIDNAISYIKRIDVIVKDSYYIPQVKKVLLLSQQVGVPVYVYSNKNDATMNRNTINDKILNYEVEIGDDRKPYVQLDLRDKILAVISYDENHIKKYDEFCEILDVYVKEHNITYDVDCYKIYEIVRTIYFNPFDFIRSINSYLHNLFKGGEDEGLREYVMLLVREMKKYKVQTTKDLVYIKRDGIKPKGPKVDYTNKYGLYELIDDQWVSVDNNTNLKDIGIGFRGFNYGGHLNKEDIRVYYDLIDNNSTTGDFLNYLMNIYTMDKVKDIVRNSGYDSYYDEYKWKLDKI